MYIYPYIYISQENHNIPYIYIPFFSANVQV